MSLDACGVTFAYPGAAPLFEGFDLTVEPGERVALSAPSGRDKTTLCRLLAGYLAPRAGRVLAEGAPVPCGIARAPRPVQLVWQHPEQAFDPLVRMGTSLAEAYPCASRTGGGRGPRARRLFDAAEEAGLLEFFGIRPAWLDRFPGELSGGELMRFSVVRSLLARPRYLVCDEMTAMLDAVTQAELWRAVLDCAEERGLGIVFVSHNPALVRRLATRQVRLSHQVSESHCRRW